MIAVGAPFCARSTLCFHAAVDQPSRGRSIAAPFYLSAFSLSVRRHSRNKLRCGSLRILISCKSSPRGGSAGGSFGSGDGADGDYLPATLLLAETVSHYRKLQHGYEEEEVKWPISRQFHPFSMQVKGPRSDSGLLSHSFLHRFPNPTIFLKISCHGEYVLPIIVGKDSIEKLIDSLQGDDSQTCPDQFQFVKNLPEKFGYKMEMVRITERVANTFFARLYFSKPGKNELFSVDARPSDAINVAYRCQVPVYVSKQIVLTDAIRLGHGNNRSRDAKPVYDVALDSAPEDPDMLVEELDLVRFLNLAIKEERYTDAAMWRDRLNKLRESKT